MVEKKQLINSYRFATIFGLGTMILLLGLWLLIGQSLLKNMRLTSQTLKEKNELVTKLETKLDTLQKLSSREEELKEKNKKVLEAFPTDKDLARLHTQFSEIAEKNGIIIETIQESTALSSSALKTKVKPLTTFTEVKYIVRAKAPSYSSIKNTINDLREALRVLAIADIDVISRLSSVKGKLIEGNTLKITLKTYVRGDKK